jgi:hypothetical protein
MYTTAITFHITVSLLVILMGSYLLYLTIMGLIRKRSYSRYDNLTSYLFLVFLYIQLLSGIILYFFLRNESIPLYDNPLEAVKHASFRYWVIEHFSVMIFTLFLTQVGRLIILNNHQDRKKFINTLFYYGFSFLLAMASAIAGLLR